MSDRTFTTLTDDAVTAVQSVQGALVGVSVITPGTSAFTALQTAVTGALGTIETNLATADANMAALVTAAAPNVIGGVTAFDGVAALNAAGSAAADEAALTEMLGYISRMAANLSALAGVVTPPTPITSGFPPTLLDSTFILNESHIV